MSNPIVVIAGPTASGKSEIAIDVAKEIDGYIINADSRQIYKEINIGTAKPSPKEYEDIPHYLYDFLSVAERYSIYQFKKDVMEIIKQEDPNKTPILVGGTGLYIDAVVYNYKLNETNDEEEFEEYSLEELKERVGEKINELNESDRENRRRLISILRTGKFQEKGEPLPHKYFIIDIPKEELNKRIEKRVEKMFKLGLEKENRKLLEAGFTYDMPGMNTIGYKEFLLENPKKEIIKNTKRYAKRQRTWFGRNKEAMRVTSVDEILTSL